MNRQKLRALRRAVKATAFDLPVTLHVRDEAQHRAAIRRTAQQVGLVFLFGGLTATLFYVVLAVFKPDAPVFFGPLALGGFTIVLGALGYAVGLAIAILNHPKDTEANADVASLFGRAEGFELRMRDGAVHDVAWSEVQLVSFDIYVTLHGPFVQKAVLCAPLSEGGEAILTMDPMLWNNGPVLTGYVSKGLLNQLGQVDEEAL